MNNSKYIPLVALMVLAGCAKKTDKITPVSNDSLDMASIDIPAADDTVRSFYDQEIGEFALLDEPQNIDNSENKSDSGLELVDMAQDYEQEFAWVEENEAEESLDPIYFGFDAYEMDSDQQTVLSENIDQLRMMVKEAVAQGEECEIIVDGHSCNITRSNAYNFTLSEKRAKACADLLIESGIPAENIKVVGRGAQYCIVEDGSIEDQWENRRVELHVNKKSAVA